MKLVVDNVACTRGSLRVIEGVSFVLNPGEGLILRGPNGIGKTTLLRTIAGLQPPVEGTIDMPEEAVAYAGHADGYCRYLHGQRSYQHDRDERIGQRPGCQPVVHLQHCEQQPGCPDGFPDDDAADCQPAAAQHVARRSGCYHRIPRLNL